MAVTIDIKYPVTTTSAQSCSLKSALNINNPNFGASLYSHGFVRVNGARYVQVPNFDFDGGDIAPNAPFVGTLVDCFAVCDTTPGCVGVGVYKPDGLPITFNPPSSQKCWLKNSMGGTIDMTKMTVIIAAPNGLSNTYCLQSLPGFYSNATGASSSTLCPSGIAFLY